MNKAYWNKVEKLGLLMLGLLIETEAIVEVSYREKGIEKLVIGKVYQMPKGIDFDVVNTECKYLYIPHPHVAGVCFDDEELFSSKKLLSIQIV